MKSKGLLLIFSILFTLSSVMAQTFEIRAVNKSGGTIGVEMRVVAGLPPSTYDLITDIVFGLKWSNVYNIDLLNTITTNYNIVKSDSRKTKNGFHFQEFSAANTPFPFPANWTINTWVEIMSVKNNLSGSGFGTFEIAEPAFSNSTIPNIGINLNDFAPNVVGSAINVPLPVKFTGFEASPKRTWIALNWSTDFEENNKGFEVERSEKENNSFKKIGWINSKTAAANKYEWVDKDVVVATKYLYRLKQVDKDNRFHYSEIRSAQLEEANVHAIHIMPNPTDKMLQVIFGSGLNSGTMRITITDIMGTVVLNRTHDLSSNKKVLLNVFSLAGGQYLLTVADNKGLVYSKMFLKK